MWSIGKRLAAFIAIVLGGPVLAYEAFPPGPVHYGTPWSPAAGSHADMFYPGPAGYGAHALRYGERFPQGPVYYGRNGSPDKVFPWGPAYYGPDLQAHETFPNGPIGYAPWAWREPYFGFPYPPCTEPQRAAPRVQWPSCVAADRRAKGGETLAPREAREAKPLSGSPASPSQQASAQPPQASIPPAPLSPTSPRSGEVSASASAQGYAGYRYDGAMLYGPAGSAYYPYGNRPGVGTRYQRYGNMLYGTGSRCWLFGNSALCW